MFYRYSSAIVVVADRCHYVPDYVLCEVEKRAMGSHLKVGDLVVVEVKDLQPVPEDAEPTPLWKLEAGPKGQKVASSRGWSRSKNGKIGEAISRDDKTPLSERQRHLAIDRRIMRKSLADKAPSGIWGRLEADRQEEIQSRRDYLRALRLGQEMPLRGKVTAADFRFGSLLGATDVRPVRDGLAAA